jgi:peptidyl-prolyl cis-trans isomerase D
MLRGIHKASASRLGKGIMAVVMGVLAISFAIWGIGDIFRGFGLSTFAKVGGTEIGIEQFREYYNDQLQQIGRRLGRPVTPDQARALGIDRQLIAQLIAQTALDEQARQLHLGVSDKDVANRITDDPSFHGANGQFDHDRFQQLIRQAGFTEARFVNEQRQVMLRKQLADAITSGLKAPAPAVNAIDEYQNEKRNIDFVKLGEAQAGNIPAPTPEELSKYFDDHKVLFRAPEYRKIIFLPLTPAEQAKWITVSDADAKKYFEEHKNDFGTPERRRVLQMVFQKPEEAQAAADAIAKGKSFSDVAKERGLKESDIDLGTITKSAIIDPAIAKAAFALKEGETSAPVKGEFGTVLVSITKIEPGKEPTYEDVAPQIKHTIAESRAKNQISDLRDKIEDERAAGSTIEETAKKLGLVATTIDAVDRSGRAPDGSVIPNLPKQPDVAAAAFATDVGVDNEALQVPGGGFIWYDVLGITPSRDRTLEEVKPKVETRWRNEQIASRLQKKADDMIGKLKSGGTLAQLASDGGLTVDKATDLQRGHPSEKVPGKVIEMAFRIGKGSPATVEGDDETERYVFVVTGVTESKPDLGAAGTKQITDTLQRSYTDDLLAQYVTTLESQLGVDINQQAVNQIVGGGTSNQ